MAREKNELRERETLSIFSWHHKLSCEHLGKYLEKILFPSEIDTVKFRLLTRQVQSGDFANVVCSFVEKLFYLCIYIVGFQVWREKFTWKTGKFILSAHFNLFCFLKFEVFEECF